MARRTLLLPIALLLLASTLGAQLTSRASLSTGGAEGDDISFSPRLSADGRFVVFETGASTLIVPDADGGAKDVLVRDTLLDTTTLISVDFLGVQSSSGDHAPDISDDGRYVVFYSFADLGGSGDTTGVADVFLRDRDPDEDGIYDEANSTTTQLSFDFLGGQPDGGSLTARLSGDGGTVAFDSYADDLLVGTGGHSPAVYAVDVATGVTEAVSIDTFGLMANGFVSDVDADGRYVVFWSADGDLVDGDTNGRADVFVRDLVTDTTVRVSVSSAGAEGDDDSFLASISDDGRYVAFYSEADTLVAGGHDNADAIYVHDRDPDEDGTYDEGNGTTTLVSVNSFGVEGLGFVDDKYPPAISGDGTIVAFSAADSFGDCCDLVVEDVDGERDVFLYERATGVTTRVSVKNDGSALGGKTWGPDLSEDGAIVAFSTWSALEDDDTNGHEDIYLRDQTLWRDEGWNMKGSVAPPPTFGVWSVPTLTGSGPLTSGSSGALDLIKATKGATSHLVVGFSELETAFKGGVLVPSPDILVLGLTVSSPAAPFGKWSLPFTWPAGVPSGFTTYFQVWVVDAAGPGGYVSSNGISATTP